MLQITISAEQVRMIRDWAEPAAIPFAVWLYRRSVKAMDEKLNKIITENSNRNRDELIRHFDDKRGELLAFIGAKFAEHERDAFARIEDLERKATSLSRSMDELKTLVLKYQDDMKKGRQ